MKLSPTQKGMGLSNNSEKAINALLHEKSAFVLFTKSIVSKYFPPLYQDHFFSRVALHNKRKLLSCVY